MDLTGEEYLAGFDSTILSQHVQSASFISLLTD